MSKTLAHYDHMFEICKSIFMQKPHGYGTSRRILRPSSDICRRMQLSSFTDLILSKVFQIRKIEDDKGKILISEGINADHLYIINSAIFALITWSESEPWSFKIN